MIKQFALNPLKKLRNRRSTDSVPRKGTHQLLQYNWVHDRLGLLRQLKPILLIALLCALSLILHLSLLIVFLLIILTLYLVTTQKTTHAFKNILLHLSLLFVIILVLSYIIIQNGGTSYYIPFAVVPILVQMLFCDLGLSLFTTLAASLAVSAVCGNNYNLFLLFTTSGLVSILLVKEAPRRMHVMRAGAVVGLVQAASLFILNQAAISSWGSYLLLFLNGIACSFIVLGILPIFEYLFKTVTDISLLELADFNQPLLQQLIKDAPGTFHHSLVVGNLSDAASKAVGAHALLARVGAYYHDVGKLSKPDYFSENQGNNENIHDDLTPTMSKLVIMNHVKEGLDLAKKYKLSPRLMDFIQQHHGDSLVYYFYLRALQGMEDKDDVNEEGFRYPGPKPSTKETAIVLLADSAEAATRTLKEPTPSNIEELVHKVINNKFIDGQLDACDLTLKDLEQISAVFIHILGAIYHSRIIYPEQGKPR
ncbi:MAG: HDIG domain-containing protein [Candidatus Omnitrophica bacterium]|nr:HDIG domain-containing protein [Candidatus Omnitrophota bacterium]